MVPTCFLEIPGFPHKDGPSYVDRRDILQYIERYADTYELRKHIKVNQKLFQFYILHYISFSFQYMISIGFKINLFSQSILFPVRYRL